MKDYNSLQAVEFVTKLKPSFSHLDPYGHVGTQFYVEYIVNHRFEGIEKELGLNLLKLAKLPVRFPVASLSMKFLSPMMGGLEYTIKSRVTNVVSKSCTVGIAIYQSQTEKLIFESEMQLACVDARTMAPVEWPEDVISLFFRAN